MKILLVVIWLALSIVWFGDWAFAADTALLPGGGADKSGMTPVVPAAQSLIAQSPLDKVGGVLLVFLVLSLVFESALTPVFTWSLFLKYLDGRGYKVPITILLAFLVFWKYDLDIFRDLLIALDYKHEILSGTPPLASFWGHLLTAMLIAGGSDGVFRLFTRFGIRNPIENRERAEVLQASITGKLVVTISGADPNTVRNLALDGSTPSQFAGDSKDLLNVSPGDHSLTVTAVVGGESRTVTQSIKINSGTITYVQFGM